MNDRLRKIVNSEATGLLMTANSLNATAERLSDLAKRLLAAVNEERRAEADALVTTPSTRTRPRRSRPGGFIPGCPCGSCERRRRGEDSVPPLTLSVRSFVDQSPKRYAVKRTENRRWSCTCPAFHYGQRECKHIRLARRWLLNPEEIRADAVRVL